MKIAIAGTSGHINYVLDALKADESLSIAAVSPGAPGESIAQLLSQLDRMGFWPHVFESAEEMFRVPGLDIAVSAAPFYRNQAIATQALRRSLAVFCEKPLALTLDGLREVERAQREADRPLCAMFGIRNEPHFAAAKRAVEQGAVGEPLLISGQKSYKLGRRPRFYAARETYGGTIPWVAIHAIDWCHWLGGKRFADVTAYHTTFANGGNGDMESTAAMLFSMQGGGAATVTADFLRPESSFTHGDDRVRIAGDQGVLEVRAGHVYHTGRNGLPTEIELKPHPGIFEMFAASVRGDGENPVPIEEGLYSTAAALLAREAADRGRTVSFAEFGW